MTEQGPSIEERDDDLAPLAPMGPPHTRAEDLFAFLTGTFLVSLGLHLLAGVNAVTGGTAGLSLLASYGVDASFAVLYLGINLPFVALALHQLGVGFTVRTLAAVAAVSGFSLVHAQWFDIASIATPYAVVGGNLIIGVGMLVLFRHHASLGGFNVTALLAQQKLGLRAGYVQMAMDVTVILASVAIVSAPLVLWSALGAAVLNLVLALNHRPGRYLGETPSRRPLGR
ncbi:YitT family protein [Nocardioides panacisoli]|uniref:YitT family protein n=1 Tax=Nocardioides panacisoli TaxID=627624 RepID=UPI001C63226B|nr:YitT family protein [Nocardioides panacisoli]QYJ03977.1 YitT family protein [Nocardioides panacisoli]